MNSDNLKRYFVLNIKHKSDPDANASKIHSTLSKYNVNELNIPFVPLKAHSKANMQIALPSDIDHSQVFKMVSSVRDELDVTLLGEQSESALQVESEASKYGLDYFILGQEVKGLDY